jgi:signal transduction histidine kinase
VRVTFDVEALDLLIRNAGPTPRPTSNGGDPGHGLIGMRERVALYDGSLRARPDERGGGFTVHARLPLEGERA